MSRIKNYSVILFDNDGCLMNSIDPWINAIRRVSTDYGLNLNTKQIREQLSELLRVKEHGLPKEKAPEYRDRVISLARPSASSAPLYDGAKNVLANLKNSNKQLGVISSNQAGLMEILEKREILCYFDVVVTGNDVKNKKPDPEGIEFALKRLNAQRENAVMIGDSWHDIQAANNARIDSILYYPAHHSNYHDINELMSYNPTHTVLSHLELGEMLLEA